jgi:hypothetical protein
MRVHATQLCPPFFLFINKCKDRLFHEVVDSESHISYLWQLVFNRRFGIERIGIDARKSKLLRDEILTLFLN